MPLRRAMRPSGPRRGMDWEGASFGNFALPQNSIAAQYLVLPSTVREQYTDPTLTVTRVALTIENEDVDDWAAGAWGVIAWDDRDDTVPGAGELPDPEDDPEFDWILHNFYRIPPARTSHTFIYPGGAIETSVSHAQRKLGNTKGILLVCSSAAVAATVGIAFAGRCLLKDH